jgi:hypothetical protein
VSRRIEIELTSARPDGSWTWRAAGAREPRGVLDGSLLQSGAKAGDILKAEADFELEGITIVSVLAPKTDSRAEPVRIEVVGPKQPEGPGVTTQLVGRSDRRSGDRRRDRDDGRPRRDRDQGRPQTGRDSGRPPRQGAAETSEATPRSGGRRGPGERRERERPDRPARPDGAPEREGESDRRRRDRVPAAPAPADADAEARKPRRLNPGNAHRRAVMESLAPEEGPIAEQVLRGGIPSVRTALHLEREKATAEGRPAPNTDELIAMAERLLPRLKAAEWRDRAEAAAANADEISLRDLRSVAAGADVARDDETRALAAKVREALERRVTAMHDEWSGEISRQLDEGRVVRALRLSARPPDPGARLDAELTQRLTEAAGAAMSPDAPADRWAALLDAVAASPVRRLVQPVGLPSDAPPELKRSAHQHSGSIPALAKLLGVSIPPPPVPSGSRRRPSTASSPPARRSNPTRRRGGPSGVDHDRAPSGRHGAPKSDRAAEPEASAGSGAPVGGVSADAPDTPAEESARPGASAAAAPETAPPETATAEAAVAAAADAPAVQEAAPETAGPEPVSPEAAPAEVAGPVSISSGAEPSEVAGPVSISPEAAPAEPTGPEAARPEQASLEAAPPQAASSESGTTPGAITPPVVAPVPAPSEADPPGAHDTPYPSGAAADTGTVEDPVS